MNKLHSVGITKERLQILLDKYVDAIVTINTTKVNPTKYVDKMDLYLGFCHAYNKEFDSTVMYHYCKEIFNTLKVEHRTTRLTILPPGQFTTKSNIIKSLKHRRNVLILMIDNYDLINN